MSQDRTPNGGQAASADRVASIVRHRSSSGLVLMLELADCQFADPGFEDALAQSLRESTDLIQLWATFSADQRHTPSAYVEGTEVGWFDGVPRNVRIHPDQGAAVADFIRRLAAWWSRREVLESRGTGVEV
jgi:hypothetical protein